MQLIAEWLCGLHRDDLAEPLVNDGRSGAFYTGVEISTADVELTFDATRRRDHKARLVANNDFYHEDRCLDGPQGEDHGRFLR
jgi:hypothetical protein